MAPSRAQSPPTARPSSTGAVLAGMLSTTSQQVLASEALPSLSELHDLTNSLRGYRVAVEEKTRRLDRRVREVRDGLGTSASAALSSSSTINPKKGSRESAAVSDLRSLPGSPSRRSRDLSASRSFAPGETDQTLPAPSSPPATTAGTGDSSHPRGIGSSYIRSQTRGRDTSTVSPAPDLPTSRPSPSSTSGSRPKIKIKRENSVGLPMLGDAVAPASPARSLTRRDSVSALGRSGLELDDEAPPSRPGRTYAKVKRKRRSSSAGGASSIELSDDDIPLTDRQDGSRGQRTAGVGPTDSIAGDMRQSAGAVECKPALETGEEREEATAGRLSAAQSAKPRQLGIRLKLNPTAAPSGIAALGAAHRPTGVHPDPEQARSRGAGREGALAAALWALPEETSATVIPASPISRPPKPYPTDPAQVDEDFTVMDWKERERQRDKEDVLEREHSASASPAPGQTHLHKETPGPAAGALASAAANRARSQNLQQVSYQAYQSWIDGWFKSLTEEDVAWLSQSERDSAPFQQPAVGRHYREVWEEEDANGGPSLFPRPSVISASQQSHAAVANGATKGPSPIGASPSTPAFDPRQLTDEHTIGLALDEARGGPLMERVLSMVLPVTAHSKPVMPATVAHDAQAATGTKGPTDEDGRVDQAERSNSNGHPHLSHGESHLALSRNLQGPPKHVHQDLAQYEERLKKELRFLDILGEDEEVDWPNRQDDEISTALRKVQSLLTKQTTINERRRFRLRDIAMDRLAYQDYASCLANVEKLVEQGWMKRQTLLRKLITSKKKQHHQKGGAASGDGAASAKPGSASTVHRHGDGATDSDGVNGALPGTPGYLEASGINAESNALAGANDSASGLHTVILTNRLPVPPLPDSLVSAMQKRRELQEAFEPMFEEMPHAKRAPTTSVYADLDLENVEMA
ncbi:unnamed protein product [Parajaminaea phylloscopi]